MAASRMAPSFTVRDREVLTRLDANYNNLKEMVEEIRKELKNENYVSRVDLKDTITKLETRLSAAEATVDDLQKFRWFILGAVGLAAPLFHIIVDWVKPIAFGK